MFLSILKVENTRIAKASGFKTEAEAIAHTEKYHAAFPDAFVAALPNGGSLGNVEVQTDKTLLISPMAESPEKTLQKLKNAALEAETLKAHEDLLATGTSLEARAYRDELAKA
tara:strand:- start:417 stop:755 length:339 start_codon:yes stop_codon:yes gene_type:complete